MKPTRLLLLVCSLTGFFWCLSLFGAEHAGRPMPDQRPAAHRRAPADLKITGPATATTGSTVTFAVSGIDIDLTKPIGDALAAVSAVKIAVNSPKSAVELDSEAVFTLAPAGVKIRSTFIVKDAGVYFVTAVWHQSPGGLAVHRITVSGSTPGPDPDPPDPPTPGGKKQVVVVYESADLDSLPAFQRELISGLKIRKAIEDKGHKFVGVWDKDMRGPDGTIPAAVAPWANAAAGKTLPALLTAPLAGGQVVAHTMPADETALWTILGGGQ